MTRKNQTKEDIIGKGEHNRARAGENEIKQKRRRQNAKDRYTTTKNGTN